MRRPSQENKSLRDGDVRALPAAFFDEEKPSLDLTNEGHITLKTVSERYGQSLLYAIPRKNMCFVTYYATKIPKLTWIILFAGFAYLEFQVG